MKDEERINARQLFSYLEKWAKKENPQRADEISREKLTPLQYYRATTTRQEMPKTLGDGKKK